MTNPEHEEAPRADAVMVISAWISDDDERPLIRVTCSDAAGGTHESTFTDRPALLAAVEAWCTEWAE